MKAALIPPTPDLVRFVDSHATYHLALSHLFDSPSGEAYQAFYRERAHRGDFITLDNGAKENGHGETLTKTLYRAKQIGAKEVVLPDAIKDKGKTLDATKNALMWLNSNDGRQAYDRAGAPRLMIVPQGATRNEWKDCLYELYAHATATLNLLDLENHLTVGVPYHYNHLFQGGLLELLSLGVTDLSGIEVHLLGWVRDLGTLAIVRDNFPTIRSVDSSRPFVYAKHGMLCGEGPYPKRDEDYFEEPIQERFEDTVHANIGFFRNFAGDTP